MEAAITLAGELDNARAERMLRREALLLRALRMLPASEITRGPVSPN